MISAGVEHSIDLANPTVRDAAAAAYTSVPGLGWVTFDYLLSLGHPTVKADRMVIAFVGDAIGSAQRGRQGGQRFGARVSAGGGRRRH